MWSMIVKILMYIISDKVVIELGKKLITRGVDSAIKGVGITDKDAQHLVKEITRSTLNSFAVHGGKVDDTK